MLHVFLFPLGEFQFRVRQYRFLPKLRIHRDKDSLGK